MVTLFFVIINPLFLLWQIRNLLSLLLQIKKKVISNLNSEIFGLEEVQWGKNAVMIGWNGFEPSGSLCRRSSNSFI